MSTLHGSSRGGDGSGGGPHEGAALVAHSGFERGIATVVEGPPPPGHVLVRTRLSGVSTGTDRQVLRNEFGRQDARFPSVPGYQSVGEVVAVGDGVRLRVGQRVAAFRAARSEPPWATWGGHSSLGLYATAQVLALDDAVDDLDAALLVTTQVGVNGAYRLDPGEDATAGGLVVVYGDGLIGAAAALAVRTRGFDVVVVGHHPHRLAPILDGDRLRVLDNTAGAPHPDALGAPVAAVIDTVQRREAQREYLPWLTRGRGQVVFSGHAGERECWAELEGLQQSELTVHFVAGWDARRLALTTRLLAGGQLTMAALVHDVIPFQEAPAMADELVANRWRPLSAVVDWS